MKYSSSFLIQINLKSHEDFAFLFQELTCDEPLDLLNACNEEGHTPLHIACLKDQPDCVQALLCAGESNFQRFKFLSSPNHLKYIIIENK
jgi:ankyrin repeat protein